MALQEVARVLQNTTRSYDTCIRYGEDEFVVLLAGCGRTAEDRRRRFQEAVGTITLESEIGRPTPLSVSAGASSFPEDGETYERLLARADRRMYRDKAQRKGQLSVGLGQLPVAANGGRAARVFARPV